MKVLQVIDQGFRTTVEEQDDTILWLTQSMHGAGGDLMLLLSGHGVHYAVLSHRQPPLAVADWQQHQPAELPRDLANMVEGGIPVYAVQEDLDERGLGQLPLQNGIQAIARGALPALYEQADQIWHW